MSILWRVNPRFVPGGLLSSVVGDPTRRESGREPVAYDAYFGLVSSFTLGQAKQTIAISADVVTSSDYTVSTYNRSQSISATFGIRMDAVVDTGQATQSVDGFVFVPAVLPFVLGQASGSNDVAIGYTSFQQIKPVGFHDNSISTSQPFNSIWRVNPRPALSDMVSILSATEEGKAYASIADDIFFHFDDFDGVGTALVESANAYLSPTGFDASVFGTHELYSTWQFTYPAGIASTLAFGTHTVYNYDSYITGTGNINASACGSATIENRNRELPLSGIASSLAFGTTVIINRNRYVQPTGLGSSLTIGQQFVWNWNREVSLPSLGVVTNFGTASLINLRRYLYPTRIDPKAVGTPTVELWIRYLRPSGTNMALYGSHTIIGPRYLKPKWTTEKWAHEHKVDYFNRQIYPEGFGLVHTNLGFNADIRNKNRYILPDGIEEPERFGPIVYNPPTDIIWVDGDINTSFVTDEADIYNSARNKIILRAAVSNGATFGTARMSPMYLNLSGKGKEMIAWGKPRVENYTRYVGQKQSGNFGRFGTAWVSFYVREVVPYGIDESCVFYEYPAPDPTTGKLPGVYPQAVTIYPDSFEGSGVTYDNCGFPRTPQIPRPSVHP